MNIRAVFSDIDGTLLNKDHRMSEYQSQVIRDCINSGIPFVLTSSRSPEGIYPILERYQLRCPIIACGGSLVLDEDRNVIYEDGFSVERAKEIVEFIEEENLDVTYNIYTKDKWLVKDQEDPRVKREESIVEAYSQLGTYKDLSTGTKVGKILCMCNSEEILEVEEKLKNKFSDMNITKSSNILIEINKKDISKATAIHKFIEARNIDIEDTVAFGDNYNDMEMLKCVRLPIVMKNAPEDIKKTFGTVSDDNNHDGVGKMLEKLLKK